MTQPPRQKALQRLAARLAKRVGAWLDGRPELRDETVCFAVLLFNAGPGGFSAYSSNADRLTMIRALKEMADQLSRDPSRSDLYQIGSAVLDTAPQMDRKIRKKIPDDEDGFAVRWRVAMDSYRHGWKRFQETATKLADKPDDADEKDEENVNLARMHGAALMQMAASLTLACSYTPGLADLGEIEIRGSDEVH